MGEVVLVIEPVEEVDLAVGPVDEVDFLLVAFWTRSNHPLVAPDKV